MDVTLMASDGRALAAALYEPRREDGPAVAGATGVPQRFYRRFATHLAGRGATVLTVDYRGVGGSRHAGGPRRDAATMSDWGRLDLNEAIGHLVDRDPDRPVAVVGHSAGGWLLSLAPNAQLVSAVLTVGSQSGYWRHWTGRARAARYVQWHAAVPAVAGLTGVLPGRYFGGETLPGGVAKEWARWGRRRDFVDGAGALPPERRFAGQLLAVGVPDDPFATAQGVAWLPSLYPRASSEVRTLGTRHRALGHFGAFRAGAEGLWDAGWAWLRGAARAPSTFPLR
ncbi:alpha/beta hydrolase [Virgisporangium ochraceum]|uniref:Alpha/beta hydrolase n=2 Tax=Virgisporangium ochraceum TaxID=65505 RepID=A0A8J3ZWK3_9ACTN|nr:alpha/beta hydrolase [Virgisporangium ochraceum]